LAAAKGSAAVRSLTHLSHPHELRLQRGELPAVTCASVRLGKLGLCARLPLRDALQHTTFNTSAVRAPAAKK
jgi:hypothetical protein